MIKTTSVFKPRASIIKRLGEELIKTESIAVLELVKNSYDANARNVIIELYDLDKPNGYISIIDDGHGMSFDIVKNVWMQIGNEHKKRQLKAPRNDLGRLPIGEKGIGRFGAHKLGSTIDLITKQDNHSEVHLSIDWTQFTEDRFLEDVILNPIEIETPTIFNNNKTGTVIKISNLHTSSWTKRLLRDVYRAVYSLQSPFQSKSGFHVELKTNHNDWVEGLLSFSEIEKLSIFRANIKVNQNCIKNFTFQFTPYKQMGLDEAVVVLQDLPLYQKLDNSKGGKRYEPLDLSKYRIGDFEIQLLVYDLSSDVTSLVSQVKQLKDYLKTNGGIQVFRDNIRVFDYGEKENDWLNIDIERVNVPSMSLSNNLVLGAVFLDRMSSTDLIEKTNREGFIDNEAYQCFKNAVDYAVNSLFVSHRNIYKEKLRSKNKVTEYVIDKLSILHEKIHIYIKDEKILKEMDDYLLQIEKEYNYIKNIYLKTSTIGMNYSVIIHEVDKVISELTKAVTEDSTTSKNIISLTKHLSQLVDNYSRLLRTRKEQIVNVTELIEESIFNFSYRFKAHNITIERFFSSKLRYIKCDYNNIVSAIINILDNSIYWLSIMPNQKKKIGLNIIDYEDDIAIVIADTGPGFAINFEDAMKPFVSTKPHGIGIGLNIVHELVSNNDGDISLIRYEAANLPIDYQYGAIIAIYFKTQERTE